MQSSLFLSQKSQNICQREFESNFIKDFKSVQLLKPFNGFLCNSVVKADTLWICDIKKNWIGCFLDNRELWPNMLFCATCVKTIQHVYLNLNDNEAFRTCFDSERSDVTQMLQLLLNYSDI